MKAIYLRECLGLDPINRKYYASGDTLAVFTPQANEPPAANFATFDTRNSHAVLDHDPAGTEFSIFPGIMPQNYAGGGVTVNLHWAAGTSTTGTVVWQTEFERVGTVLDIDADSFAAGNKGTTVAPTTSGLLGTTAIAHTDGAQMDSLAVGEGFRLRVSRQGGDAQDSAPDDGELMGIEIKET